MLNCHQKSWGKLASILLLLIVICFAGCQKPPAITQFYADNSTVVSGDKVKLHWSISGADSISLKEDSGKTIATSDNVCIVTPLKTTSYSLIASNSAGTDNKTVTVSIDWEMTGFLYLNQGNYNEALKSYNKAIELNPYNPLSYVNRGAAYFTKGQNDIAITDFSKAIEVDPKFVTALD